MKKKVWIWILSIVVGLGIIAAIVFFFIQNRIASVSEEMSEETFTVQKAAERELSETILVTGKIVPESEQKVFIEPDKGSIIEYSVAENQKVKAGDPLFKYDASKLQSELNKAVRERDLIQKRAKAEEKQIADMNKRIKNAKANSGSASASSEQEAEVPIESVDERKNGNRNPT